MQCDAILSQGVFDTLVVDISKSTSENLVEWLKAMDWSQVKEKMDAGLKIGLPIKGIPLDIGGNFTEEDFNEWKREVDQGRTRQFTEEETMKIVSSSASKSIVEAWLSCVVSTGGLGRTGIVTTLGAVSGASDLVYTARYLPTSIEDYPPRVTAGGFQVAGARPINALADGSEIPLAGVSVLLRRDGMESVTVVLNTEKGTATSTAPGIAPPPPKQTDLHLSRETDGITYTLRMRGAEAARNLVDSVKYTISYHFTISIMHGTVSGPGSVDLYSNDASSEWAVTYVEKHEGKTHYEVNSIRATVSLKNGQVWDYSALP